MGKNTNEPNSKQIQEKKDIVYFYFPVQSDAIFLACTLSVLLTDIHGLLI